MWKPTATPPAPVPAVVPLRVLPVDPPIKDGLNAAFKMGAVKMTPYGFIKAAVRCRFTSAPSGADITLDGHFVGSTPSTLSLNTGMHSVIVSLPGFIRWSRDMNVTAGADLTVNATLEKAQ